ncbi:hypothetical protein [Fodinibius sp.]|uniref:hypothetical protein n=1 Tax=Fodinibius sp. TaxID=1872440 RepID=UPI002ACE209D|nr:hypothetical protein [Fodinibius sp.]MDZ7660733.1 hypothetical protein [Fodinibius sp.]
MMKKADTILLKAHQTPHEAYEGFARHLPDYGFGIENTSDKLKVLKTGRKSFDDTGGIGGFSDLNASVRSSRFNHDSYYWKCWIKWC